MGNSRDEIAAEQRIGDLLLKRGKTLSLAESCTGGLIGHRITNVSGSAAYFLMDFVVYSNDAKIKFLGVNPSLLKEYGAVSREVAVKMAEGAKKASGSSYSLAVTGIAGPTGGTSDKPVGTVFIAVTSDRGTICNRYSFCGSREEIKNETAQNALELLGKTIREE